MSDKNYKGFLAIANPSNPKDELEKAVFLIVNQTENYTVSFQLNKPHTGTDLAIVAQNLGIPYYKSDTVWYGGHQHPEKIHVVHSLDWVAPSTAQLTKEIGVTHDISVLLSLAGNEGPYYFRAIAGFWSWKDNIFDKQLSKIKYPEYPHKWELLPATLESVFQIDETELWEYCIEQTIQRKVSEFF